MFTTGAVATPKAFNASPSAMAIINPDTECFIDVNRFNKIWVPLLVIAWFYKF